MQIAILLYPGVTALDAVGPWEILWRIPGAEVRFVSTQVGPVVAEGNVLLLGVTHSLSETPRPDVLLIPGGPTTAVEMIDDELLAWLRVAHLTSRWTTSVCTGSLILGAAGILKGVSATTHWHYRKTLRILGAKVAPNKRIAENGNIVTAAGVTAGIDLALWLASVIAGQEMAEAIQLAIEYDPRPPFDAGNTSKASEKVRRLARRMLDERLPVNQKRIVAKIAWRRLTDFIRTGR
jgi:transcriptional regulator GlxA family with amidase domain